MAFVIGDGLSSDQLCGHYKNYSPNVARISQTCDVPIQESDNPHWKCIFLKMEDLQSISIRALELSGSILGEHVECLPVNERQCELNDCFDNLKKISQHMHDNALGGVWFGVNPPGILGAFATDLMYAFCMD